VNRRTQAVVALLLGGTVLKISLTDVSLRYVKAGLRPLLVVAGVLLVVAAVMTLWYELRPGRGALEGTDHGHGHGEPRVGWFLLVPVLALLVLAPPALGSDTAGQAGSVLAAENAPSDYTPLPPGDPVELTLLDYASRAVYDAGKTLRGRSLRLTGFVTPGPDGQPVLARIVLSCCAADGRPIKVALAGDVPPDAPAGTWLTVVGTYSPDVVRDAVDDAPVPSLQVTSWQATTQPEQPYE
jgi:uncharacterized repeat protein (TIGR03943 family)